MGPYISIEADEILLEDLFLKFFLDLCVSKSVILTAERPTDEWLSKE